MAIDPVCHLEVDEKTAQWKSEYKGKTYYLCAPGCKASFDKDPEKYLSGGELHAGHTHQEHHQYIGEGMIGEIDGFHRFFS